MVNLRKDSYDQVADAHVARYSRFVRDQQEMNKTVELNGPRFTGGKLVDPMIDRNVSDSQAKRSTAPLVQL